MTHDEPLYSITPAFEIAPIVTCFGLEGLIKTLPRLEPNIYAIFDCNGRMVGDARRGLGPVWELEVDGVRAGPGYIIV